MADHDNPELTEAQIDALADAGNRALNDHYHEELCHCSDWPESCVSSGHYFAGSWDTAAFSIGMAAVIGAWESMRATAENDELARLRDAATSGAPEVEDPARSLDLLALMPERSAAIVSGHLARLLGEQARLRARVVAAARLDDERLSLIQKRRTHCEAIRFETEDERPVHAWGPSQYPGRDMCERCTVERAWAEDPDADEVVLLAEVDRLRARVAELEALEPALIQTCRKCGAGYDLGQPCSTCAFRAQMAAALADLPEAPRG